MELKRYVNFRGFLTAGILLICNSCAVYSPAVDFTRMIEFSGEKWLVKNSTEPVGPGPNFFSSGPENVWVDSAGALHLAVRFRNGRWQCAEITSARRFFYGKYTFKVSSPLNQLDPSAVLGLFSWNPISIKHNREVDIEISRQGDPASINAQYVVQPYHLPDHQHFFEITGNSQFTTHEFIWKRNIIEFKSYYGHDQPVSDDQMIAGWSYNQYPPKYPGRIQVRINLWLFNGIPPLNGRDFEIVMEEFQFTPSTLAELFDGR
jgi:hypothetical protein